MTLGEKFLATGGRPSGFDYMRLGLAMCIFGWHTIPITYGNTTQLNFMAHPFCYHAAIWGLPAFFAFSGFLVAASLARCKTVAGFLFLRGIRIFPALAFVTTISAFVLGPLTTRLPLHLYFQQRAFWHYLLNYIGDVHSFLPGVFPDNALPGVVNLQLWTIPIEIECYLLIAAVAVVGLAFNRRLFLAFVLIFFGGYIVYRFANPGMTLNINIRSALIMAFLFGTALFAFRDSIPHSGPLALFCFALAAVLMLVPNGIAFAPPLVAYDVIYLGLANPKKILFLESGADFSYGIYLYSFPIQQAVAALPYFHHTGWTNLAVALPFVLLVSAASWHFWEKPCLEFRRLRPAIDKWFAYSAPGRVTRRIYRMAVPAVDKPF